MMSWFLLGDVPYTRRRGIIIRSRYLYDREAGPLAKAIDASKFYDPNKELDTVRVATSNKDSITFEVWQRDLQTSWNDPRYTVFYVVVQVDDDLLEQTCEGDYGRGMKRNWYSD